MGCHVHGVSCLEQLIVFEISDVKYFCQDERFVERTSYCTIKVAHRSQTAGSLVVTNT